MVHKHYLKCLISANSPAYDTWKKGDLGVASFEYNDLKKSIVPSFTNTTAENR